MTWSSERLASWEGSLRPMMRWLPPAVMVRLYSRGRRHFLSRFAEGIPRQRSTPWGNDLSRTLWGVDFRFPLFNAAGMFKNGEAYEVVARQGAGAYLAGTTTGRPRQGNVAKGIRLPFAPYPRSGAASNWLGLPNLGHRQVAQRLRGLPRHAGFPVGVSLSADPAPDLDRGQKLEALVQGLHLYREAGVDFIEMNESCPNTEAEQDGGLDDLRGRLAHVAKEFLASSDGPPVIVKLSCDTRTDDVDSLVEMLLELGFDGINLGNTSVDYARHRPALAKVERPLFDHFTRSFGGGLSGRPLKEDSLRLAQRAVERVRSLGADSDFHVWRTGGIEGADDVRRSLDVGVAMCQWYTGYFEGFSRDGHRLYGRVGEELGAGFSLSAAADVAGT